MDKNSMFDINLNISSHSYSLYCNLHTTLNLVVLHLLLTMYTNFLKSTIRWKMLSSFEATKSFLNNVFVTKGRKDIGV